MKKLLKSIDLIDFVVVIGLCFIVYGSYLIYQPAAYLVAGFLLVLIGLLIAKKGGD